MSTHKYLLFLFSISLLTCVVSGCDQFVNDTSQLNTIPQVGTNPLPTINGLNYHKNKGIKHPQISDDKTINWSTLTPLLKRAQQQTGQTYVAVYSVRDSTHGKYHYRTAGLIFSDHSRQAANGGVRPYFFESAKNSTSPLQLVVAYIPDSIQAYQEMTQWILSKAKVGSVFKNEREIHAKDPNADDSVSSELCFIPETTYTFYNQEGEIIDIITVGHYEPCVIITPGDDGPEVPEQEGPPTGGYDVPCEQQIIPTGDCQNDDPCQPTTPGGGIVVGCGGGPGPDLFPDPCDTGNPKIDDIEQKLRELWVSSNPDALDINQRKEQGGWIIKTPTGYRLEKFSSNFPITACTITLPTTNIVNMNIPANTVGIVHTHPYEVGEDIGAICGKDKKIAYNGRPSKADITLQTRLAINAENKNYVSQLSDFTGIVIDKDGIRITDGSLGLASELTGTPITGEEIKDNTQTKQPCGYK